MKVNAVLVSVDFADLLSITLPRNARHFHRVIVVSSFDDHATARVVASVPNAELLQTNAFYQHGAIFNKGLALESAFDALRRDGWICILDADILLPEFMDLSGARPGKLYTPRRRMLHDVSRWQEFVDDFSELPLHEMEEWAGYFQLFHASDPALKYCDHWYGVDWKHAGGCDSTFASRWPITVRARPPFEVLHLGEDGKNWCGRVTPGPDGKVPAEAASRAEMLKNLMAVRKKTSSFAAEKIRIPVEVR